MSLYGLSVFALVYVLAVASPGPGVAAIVARALGRGTHGMPAFIAGFLVGDLIWFTLAATGLAMLAQKAYTVFVVVKFAGAAYLLYLGVRAIAAKPAPKADDAPRTPAHAVTPARAFWQAIPAEVLNPKTALFFLAFLPQFVRADHAAPFAQFVVLGLVFVAMSAAYSTLLVLAIGPIGRALKRVSWLAKWQGKIIGSIFIALGLKVALQKQ